MSVLAHPKLWGKIVKHWKILETDEKEPKLLWLVYPLAIYLDDWWMPMLFIGMVHLQQVKTVVLESLLEQRDASLDYGGSAQSIMF